jgi:hypothetical protein
MPMGVLAPGFVHARPSALPPSTGGGPRVCFWVGILISLLVRSPCKISESYDNPLWAFEQKGQGVRSNGRRSAVIWQEDPGYIAAGAHLYYRRSTVKWQEECGYMMQ